MKLYLPKLERPIISTSDLVKFICPLICSFLTLQYSLFGFQWTYFLRFVRFDLISHRVGIFDLSATSPSFGRGNVPLVGSSGLEPPTSRLSGARSNHLSYEPIQFLSVYLVHSLTFFFCLPSVRTLSAPFPSSGLGRFCRISPSLGCPNFGLVEMMGIEPMTPCLQGRCSPSWATPPFDKWIVKSEEWRVKSFGWKSFAFSSSFRLSFEVYWVDLSVTQNWTTSYTRIHRSFTSSRRLSFLVCSISEFPIYLISLIRISRSP